MVLIWCMLLSTVQECRISPLKSLIVLSVNDQTIAKYCLIVLENRSMAIFLTPAPIICSDCSHLISQVKEWPLNQNMPTSHPIIGMCF